MRINQFLDATYLKTANQANLTEEENRHKVVNLVNEAILYDYKLVMIRAKHIPLAKEMLKNSKKRILIGTVIGFHEGTATIKEKIEEAKEAIYLGADELDFVINYKALKAGNLELVKEEVTKGIELCVNNKKVVKWIIEVAALSEQEIVVVSQLIKEIVLSKFEQKNAKNVFVKSSTGFYKTKNNLPNGATFKTMKLIAQHAKPLKIKAAGGVRDYQTALKMISLGVDRIGTSSSKEIVHKAQAPKSDY
ncbi:deoxyribose-phosphate aldolase [Polaribacter aquimarinus]|uniref:Deoxyribose-phosphate aldolase n=1 Tax=Polaribacter aquimarinus TaxID=2100726 RepID=A0A2U2JBR0_9FLAO|nr:deoxyribose-phosphate aldolase [Polaribacter aquimarinus]PWG05777.1 deoxyribose-phosphate aldolase [Polaribacter aquimarinus]